MTGRNVRARLNTRTGAIETPDFTQSHGLLRTLLTRGASGTFSLKLGGRLVAFVTAIILARHLGADGYGIYAYALAWLSVLGVFAQCGFPRLFVRETARLGTRGEWDILAGLHSGGTRLALTLAVVIALAVAGITGIILHTGFENRSMALAVMVAAIVLPVAVGQSLYQASLQGIHRVVLAQFPALLVQPLAFLAIVATAVLMVPGKLAVVEIMGVYLVSALLALCLSVILWHRYRPASLLRATVRHETRRWLTAAAPLLIITITMTINRRADLLMLGWLGKPADIGIYAAASRAAELVLFVMQSINVALSPAVAAFAGTGMLERLQRAYTETARVGFALTCIASLIIILLGSWYLGLYGAEFLRGETALWILIGAQIVNAAYGSVGVVLIMSGFERSASIATIAGALTNLGLNAIWIPRYGIEGAAMATLAGTVVWNTLLAWYVNRRIGLRTGLLGTRKTVSG